jgi:hypothetical protein
MHSRTRYRRCGGRRVPFLCFALPDSFSAVPWASGPVFMFFVPLLVLGDTDGVGSRFHIVRSRTCFWRREGRRLLFSCFAVPDSYSAVPWASAPVFMFCAPELVFGGTDDVGSRDHIFAPEHVFGGAVGVGSRSVVLRARTRFWWYRRRRVPFSSFALRDSFWAVRRASGPVIIFCAPGHVIGSSEGVGSCFLFLRTRTRFRRFRGRRVPFSCFALRDTFSAVSRASCPVFMFCAPGLVFGSTEGVRSRFHVVRSRTRFRRYRGRRLSISCFARPNSFSAVPTTSALVFMFCAPGHVFGGAVGVGSRFHVLRSRTRFRRFRGCWVRFSCFASPH